jgi:ribosomal protein S12 methylthiotransferase
MTNAPGAPSAPTKKTFYIENLGCPKNAVEGEGMAERLTRAGYASVERAADAAVVVVNTCSFIRPAQEESIARLFHYIQRRRGGQKVVAAGCLAERFGEALTKDIPELDGVLGTRRWFEIDRLVQEIERGGRPCWHGAEPVADPTFTRQAGGPTAYVKIAEGCNMSCTFCAIPGFKGAQRSKSPAAIVSEIRDLVAAGVREVILVSQNTTAYGLDLLRDARDVPTGAPSTVSVSSGVPSGGQRAPLARLLEEICAAVPDLPWLRFHYCYPGWVDDDLLQTMARLPQVVKYLDMPLQHAHPEMLKAMRRPRDVEHVKGVLRRAREIMPDIALRTTFIAGFPGETATHFQAILRLMEEVRFDHVGVFPYYPEEGTPAAGLPGQVSERTAQRRKARALEVQQEISLQRNRDFVGREVEVLVEGEAEGGPGQLIGRTYRDAPEVDGFVLFAGQARRGDFVRVQVAGAGPYDLFGQQVGLAAPALPAPQGGPPGAPVSGPSPLTSPPGGRRVLRTLPVLQPR